MMMLVTMIMVRVVYFDDYNSVVFDVIHLCWRNPIIITKAARSVPEVNVNHIQSNIADFSLLRSDWPVTSSDQ